MIIGFDGSRAFGEEKGGTENYSYQLLKALGKIDRENRYVVYTRGKISSKTRKEITLNGGSFTGGVEFRNIGWSRLWTQGGLALVTWRDKLDVLFVPAHTLPVLRRPGLPTLVTIHGLEYEFLPEHYKIPQKYYLTWSTRYAVKKATKIISVSKFTANELVKRLGADRKKIKVVPEGVDSLLYSKVYSLSFKSTILHKYSINTPYVLFVGVIQPRKNLVRLIEVFSILTRSVSVKLSLVIVGKKGWMYDDVFDTPKKYEVEDRVKFVGFVSQEELPVLFQEAKVYVQPSLTEGFGLPVLEAMAVGTPVVAANAGALPEVVGEAGVLVNPYSSKDMAMGMKEALTNKNLRKDLINKGRRRAREFNWEKTALQTMKVLKKAIEL